MNTRQRRKTKIGRLVVPVIAGSCLLYFLGEAQTGRYGLESKLELAALLERREAELERMVAKRESLEQRVMLIQDGALERDMIDEQVRRALNLGAEDEIVILR